ncbi:MAG TPA: endolytic transglycosylase MltG [Candidatus Egerieimonas faecigallinarum]|nr:endolytic transglycosylase MltG [Candidatus Egerieimonas faecigallinarum]
MGKKKKKNTGYQVAVSGAKGILRLLIYLCVLLAILFAGSTAYNFGYAIFYQEAVASSNEAVEVTVTVEEGDSAMTVARMLENRGLVENALVFRMQELISDYHGQIKPGTYILNTAMEPEQMLKILSQTDTTGQPEQQNVESEEVQNSESE